MKNVRHYESTIHIIIIISNIVTRGILLYKKRTPIKILTYIQYYYYLKFYYTVILLFAAVRIVLRGKAHAEWQVLVSGDRSAVKDDQYFIDNRSLIFGKGLWSRREFALKTINLSIDINIIIIIINIHSSRPSGWSCTDFAARNSPFPVQISTSTELVALFVWK